MARTIENSQVLETKFFERTWFFEMVWESFFWMIPFKNMQLGFILCYTKSL
jgi:hypothetical protein